MLTIILGHIILNRCLHSISLGKFNNHTFEQLFQQDEVAEWLRRWTANPLGSARVGSNPILVVYFLIVSTCTDMHIQGNRKISGQTAKILTSWNG